jgi:glucosamine--fructose-6-phosphate aminotransferase (isomerizing)
MCGIVGGISQRQLGTDLLESLKRLEYRGYDSAGIALISNTGALVCERVNGKITELIKVCHDHPLSGMCGIAHTRWATHGKPSIANAHPHISNSQVAVVHNGIIENYQELKQTLLDAGYTFHSDTDTEVIAHLIHFHLTKTENFFDAVAHSIKELNGMYAIAVISPLYPNEMIAARLGSPLVVGLGQDENYLASDITALLAFTKKFIVLEDGDIAFIRRETVSIYDQKRKLVSRKIYHSTLSEDLDSKGSYPYFMLKEINEQPQAMMNVLEGRIDHEKVITASFGTALVEQLSKIKRVLLVACGTSYHAALTAHYWFEEIVGIPTQAEIASEYRYRHPAMETDTLFIAISQSGETADTLAALKLAKENNYPSLAICNVSHSSLAREADYTLITRAGPEIGVASTKTFTTQLALLFMVMLIIGKNKKISPTQETKYVQALLKLPVIIEQLLSAKTNKAIQSIALEGALKLQEISYIPSEAYPAGELKHGPLAIIEKGVPTIILAPKNILFNKTFSNIEEVLARDALTIVFSDDKEKFQGKNITLIQMPEIESSLIPLIYAIAMQLLAYYTAINKGTDVDQPRNLAKSVTVE